MGQFCKIAVQTATDEDQTATFVLCPSLFDAIPVTHSLFQVFRTKQERNMIWAPGCQLWQSLESHPPKRYSPQWGQYRGILALALTDGGEVWVGAEEGVGAGCGQYRPRPPRL